MLKCLLLTLGPAVALAQTTEVPKWSGGLGLGNGIEVHAGRQQGRWLLLGRVRYKVWGVSSGPGSAWQDGINPHSHQVEVAALGGYALPLGKETLYGAAGLSYLNGRQLGEFRYSINQNSLLGSVTYYYAYRDYQALGLPLEVGLLTSRLNIRTRVGLALQANLNPEQPVYCVLLTFWLGDAGYKHQQTVSNPTN